MKKTFLKIIKDIIPVIIGIWIALLTNNCNENRKDKSYLNKIFSSIEEELAETKTDIDKTLIKQKSLLDTISYYINDDKISLLEIALKTNNVKVPLIKTSSWKAISNTKIELIDYNNVKILTNIEEKKKVFEMKVEKLLDFLYDNPDSTNKTKKVLMKIMIMDIIYTENDIKKQIIQFEELNASNT